jgi:hypothetical protein
MDLCQFFCICRETLALHPPHQTPPLDPTDRPTDRPTQNHPRAPNRSSLSTVRVLVISRSAYASLERTYPIASRLVLENLRQHTEEAVTREFPGFTGTSDFADLLAKSPGSLLYSWASPELVELMLKEGDDGAAAALGAGGSGLSVRQQLVISNLVRVNTVISQTISKQNEDRTTEFL